MSNLKYKRPLLANLSFVVFVVLARLQALVQELYLLFEGCNLLLLFLYDVVSCLQVYLLSCLF